MYLSNYVVAGVVHMYHIFHDKGEVEDWLSFIAAV